MCSATLPVCLIVVRSFITPFLWGIYVCTLYNFTSALVRPYTPRKEQLCLCVLSGTHFIAVPCVVVLSCHILRCRNLSYSLVIFCYVFHQPPFASQFPCTARRITVSLPPRAVVSQRRSVSSRPAVRSAVTAFSAGWSRSGMMPVSRWRDTVSCTGVTAGCCLSQGRGTR